MPDITPQRVPTCYTCGSPLIKVSQKTEASSISFSPSVTITEYRCSNKECQDDKDKQEAMRIKARDEKEKDKQERLEAKKNLQKETIASTK